MAREVSVKITANTSGFDSGMNSAASKAQQTAQKIKASFDSGLSGINKNSRAINTLSSGLGKVGLVAAVGIGAAVKSAADFDAAMSSVAATGSDARANLSALRDAAIKAGADTKYSATEAAGGLEALAKAGVSSKDALGGGLSGALNLAAAGNQSVAESAETAASAMNQFGLQGKDVPHIADLLAQAAGTAQGEVSDMAAALNQSGLVANQFGLSIEDSTQALALFAQNGLVGSDAGTSFKTMLTSLYAPAGTSAKALDKLHVSAYETSGAIKPLGQVADELKAKLDGLSEQDRNQALKNIFGSDALRSGSILLSQGSAGLSKMATEFSKFGTASDVARTKMDNLKGDLEQLRGSFETALIGVGEGGAGPLRSLTQGVTNAVNSFNKLGGSTKSAILAVGGIGAAGALGVAGVLRLATGAAEAYSAFGKLSINTPRLAGALRALGTAAAAVGVTLVALQTVGAVSRQFKANFVPNIEAANDALLTLSATGSAANLDSLFNFNASSFGDPVYKAATDVDGLGEALARIKGGGLTGALDQVRVGIDKFTGTTGILTSVTEQFGNLDQSLTGLASGGKGDQAAASFTKIQQAADAQGVPLEKLIGLFPQYAQSAREAASANGTTVTSTQQLADIMAGRLPSGVGSTASALETAGAALDAIGAASTGTESDLNALNTALFATANAALATSDAQIGFEGAVDAAAAAAKKNGDNLKVSTAAGRENKTALNQLAAAGQAYVQSLIDQGSSSKTVKSAVADARGEYVKQAQAMGESKKSANDLADAAGLIPKNVAVTVDTKAGNAKAELAQVNAAIKDLPKDQQVEVRSAFKSGGVDAAKAKIAELKDKHVNIDAKSNVPRVAEGATNALGRVHDEHPRIDASSNAGPVAKSSQNKLSGVKGKSVKVSVTANTAGAAAARAAIASVHDKTVFIRVGRKGADIATGGLVTPAGVAFRGPLHRTRGGPVWGSGTSTSDSIPAMLSNGEFVVRAAAVKAVGIGELTRLNAQGFANGGSVSLAGGSVALTSDKEILRSLIAQSHVDQAQNLKERRAADKEVAKAAKKLNDTQSAALDSIKQLSTSLQEPYRSKSTDVDDVLAALQEGAADLSTFSGQVTQLKGLGLSQQVIDQITADGAVNGSELASQIIAGGQDLVNALNLANKNLTAAAGNVGAGAVGLKKASGGYIAGSGTATSDSISARLSNGEYVVNAAGTAANRGVLDAINYGRAAINEHRFMPAYAGGGYVSPQHVDQSFHEGSMVLQYQGNLEQGIRLARAAKRDNLTMARLTGTL